MKLRIFCTVIMIVCISFFVYEKYCTKQTIYISFEDLDGYSYCFKKDSLGKDKTIVLQQEGRFSYISWELDIQTDKIRRMDHSFLDEVDVISQYWIINNFSGLKIETNPTKGSDYNINVLKWENDTLYFYPISCLHYLIE